MNDNTSTTRRRRRAALVGAVAGLALAGGLLAAGSASAATPTHPSTTPHQRVNRPQQTYYSTGFHIYNFTSHPMKLTAITGDGNFEGHPEVGSIVQPGDQFQDFELQRWFAHFEEDDAHYDILGDNGQTLGTYTVHMATYVLSVDKTSCKVTGPFSTSCGNTDTNFNVQDKPGTVVDVPGGQGQHQAEVLKHFCANDNKASAQCDFHATSQTARSGGEHLVTSLINNTDREQELTAEKGDTVTEENSVEAGFTVSGEWSALFGKVSAEFEAKYGHVWTHEHNYSVGNTFMVAPHHRGEIWGTVPMIRDTGDFTVVFHDTTFRLHDVYFDQPDPTSPGGYEDREYALS